MCLNNKLGAVTSSTSALLPRSSSKPSHIIGDLMHYLQSNDGKTLVSVCKGNNKKLSTSLRDLRDVDKFLLFYLQMPVVHITFLLTIVDFHIC